MKNPDPDTRTPAARSRIPRDSPSSQWGRGVKGNSGAVPQLRTIAEMTRLLYDYFLEEYRGRGGAVAVARRFGSACAG